MIKFHRTIGTYGCFSNFFRAGLRFQGLKWKSSEHAYQACKFDPKELYPGEDITIWEKIRRSSGCRAAKNIGSDRRLPLIDGWDDKKFNIMKNIVRAKFSQQESFKQLLLDTGDEELIEDSPIDYIWGCGADGTGSNWLGKALMEIRSEFRR